MSHPLPALPRREWVISPLPITKHFSPEGWDEILLSTHGREPWGLGPVSDVSFILVFTAFAPVTAVRNRTSKSVSIRTGRGQAGGFFDGLGIWLPKIWHFHAAGQREVFHSILAVSLRKNGRSPAGKEEELG